MIHYCPVCDVLYSGVNECPFCKEKHEEFDITTCNNFLTHNELTNKKLNIESVQKIEILPLSL